jgi:cell division protein FtsB
MSWRIAAAVAVLACLTAPVFGQTAAAPSTVKSATVKSDSDRLQQLEREVADLKAEIAALKATTAAAESGRIAELERKLDVLAGEIEAMKIGEAAQATASENGFGPAASKVYRAEKGLSIGGYGEVLYQNFRSDRSPEIDLLRAVLYFGYKFDDKWLLNSEVEYEHGLGAEVEFAYIDYLWKPQMSFRAGRLLLPMGFLNELHEPTVFLGARRPDIEQMIIPTTWRENGFGLFGHTGPFTYRTYLLAGLNAAGFNSEGLQDARQEGIESKTGDVAWVGRLDYADAADVPGLLLGGSVYTGNSGQDLRTAAGRRIGAGTRMYEGHLEWKWRGLEFRALGVQTTIDDVAALNAVLGRTGEDSIGSQMQGYYVQLGYDVLAGHTGARSLTPFARYESYDTQKEVPAGFLRNPANDVNSLTLGIAFKPIDQIVLKADYQKYDNRAKTGVDQINVLLGYIF